MMMNFMDVILCDTKLANFIHAQNCQTPKNFHAQTKFHFQIKITTQLKQDINLTGNCQTICCLEILNLFFLEMTSSSTKKVSFVSSSNEDKLKIEFLRIFRHC